MADDKEMIQLLCILIINIFSQGMHEKSDDNIALSKNLYEENDVSTRQQLYCKEQHLNSIFNKEEQSVHIAQHLHRNPQALDSIIMDDDKKKKCHYCQESQKMILQLEKTLTNQRRKNLKYKKIMSVRISKEQQLEQAYMNLAIELKKNISLPNYSFSKSKGKIQLSYQRQKQDHSDHSVNDYKRIVNELYEEKRIMMNEIQNWKEKYLALLQSVNKQKKVDKVEPNQKIMNQFYEKEIVKLHEEIFSLKQALSSKSVKENMKIQKKQIEAKGEKTQEQLENEIFEKQLQEQIQRDYENLEKQRIQEVNEPAQKSVHKQLSSNQQEILQQIERISQIIREQSFHTARSWESGEQFYTVINETAPLHSMRQSLSNIISSSLQEDQQHEVHSSQFNEISQEKPQFEQVSSVKSLKVRSSVHQSQKEIEQIFLGNYQLKQSSYLRNSQKSTSKKENERKSQKQQYSFQDTVKRQKIQILDLKQTQNKNIQNQINKISIVTFHFQGFLKKLIQFLNKEGRIFNIEIKWHYFLQCQFEKLAKDMQRQEFYTTLVSNFQEYIIELIKSNTKIQIKQLNYLELLYSESQSKKSQIESEYVFLEKKLKTLQQFNNRLQFSLSQMSMVQPYSKQSQSVMQKHSMINSIFKRKISFVENPFKENQVQCDIISYSTYNTTQEFIQKIPILFQESLKQNNVMNRELIVMFDYDHPLEDQFKLMISTFFQLLISQKNPIVNKDNKNNEWLRSRQRSRVNSEASHDVQYYEILEVENCFMKSQIEEKNRALLKLNEKLSLLRSEKDSLVKQMAKKQSNTTNLQKKIEQLQQKLARKSYQSNQIPVKSIEQQEFKDFNEEKQFNNVFMEKQQAIKSLKQQVSSLEIQIQKLKSQNKSKRKKVIYFSK